MTEPTIICPNCKAEIVQEGLAATRVQARKEVEDEQKLKVMEKEQIIAAMQKQIEDLKRKAEQGSQQLQRGERSPCAMLLYRGFSFTPRLHRRKRDITIHR